ncbi:MAG: hypothetical protein J07HX5_01686 [halophilic archaeon J07HX5]|nr:MAG: hypothetical protein J07HX5_01686 [halophilic archaeon J07HX5]
MRTSRLTRLSGYSSNWPRHSGPPAAAGYPVGYADDTRLAPADRGRSLVPDAVLRCCSATTVWVRLFSVRVCGVAIPSSDLDASPMLEYTIVRRILRGLTLCGLLALTGANGSLADRIVTLN